MGHTRTNAHDSNLRRRPSARVRSPLPAVVAGALILSAVAAIGCADSQQSTSVTTDEKPNILWITSEDNGPHLGAYGDSYATTPNLDALAARGYRYRVAWSNGPVCAAARTALIAGVYPESTGGEHMRSLVRLPAEIRLYPSLLREAGYYTTNNLKTDYNYAEVETVWDESSATAHWKNRPEGQPFFAIFNHTQTHESQVRQRPHEWLHEVDAARVPSYIPDVRETREDWAQYYDRITTMDELAGERLAEIEAAGLADDTVIMYFGDHGAGLPRSKRSPYNSGLQVPFIVYVPPKFRHLAPAEAAQPGSESRRLVSFVDFAPTLLSLAGVEPPSWMQGRAFLGAHATPDPDYIFGFRGRMDERYDLTRSVRDQRYVYLRNYMPHRPHGQHVQYMFQTPTTSTWRRMYDEGLLPPPQTYFWEPKPSEELYDLEDDPYETRNLAGSPAHADALARLRQALDSHARAIRDVGFLPEYELHRDEAITSVYERARDGTSYDFDRIYEAARQASDRAVAYASIRAGLNDRDPVVRYWTAVGAVIRGRDAVALALDDLEKLLDDPEPGPRIAAAEALGRFGPASLRRRAVERLIKDGDATVSSYVSLLALHTMNQFTDLEPDELRAIAALPTSPPPGELERGGDYRAILQDAIARNLR